MDYSFFQHYWWLIISLLGALLVFLLFVQGGQSLTYRLGKDDKHLNMIILSLKKKWELTFTTLVTFGGAFFASFPLFYSTSFGGAYWLWMLILSSFIVQAVSYEFIAKQGNLLGKSTYQFFLFLNGFLGPFLLGIAVSTFFTGSEFMVVKENITSLSMPVISSWQNPLHGLEALGNVWNLMFGLAVFFLSRSLGALYFINAIDDEDVRKNAVKQLLINASAFLLLFLTYGVYILMKDGFAVDPETSVIVIEPLKYLHNFLSLPWVLALFLIGVVLVLIGFIRTIMNPRFIYGIWYAGIGVILTVFALFVILGFNYTAYYPSVTDPQSSLTISNSSSGIFTLKVMSIVSLMIPFVFAYIWHTWKLLDKGKINAAGIDDEYGY